MGWILELTRFHGPNVVSYEVFRGTSRTPVIGAHLPMITLDHLPDLKEALERYRSQDLILMGNLNMYLDEAQNLRSHLVIDMLTEFALINLMSQSRQVRLRLLKTWAKVLQGTVLRARCDYVLGTDRGLFELMGIRDTMN